MREGGLQLGARCALALLAAIPACGFEHGSLPSDGGPGDADAPDAPPAVPRSCKELHTAQPSLASSDNQIDPDGPGGQAPITVFCDMTTDGGGWSIVFSAPNSNLSSMTLAYTSSSQNLLDDSQTALIAYRTSAKAVTDMYATFPLPAGWKTQCPFSAAGTDVNTTVSVSGGPGIATTVRYGYQGFSSVCGDPWNGASNVGRLCVVGTLAPFYAGFSTPSNDACGDSTQSAGLVSCGSERVFTIAVR